ncbi:MAG: 50S ribosomal protein L24 [Acidimicrobiia bacterium]|nr:50S ribosomal protein L24 [Acidimicrobiia bacterium]
MKIRKGDRVRVIAGKDGVAGHEGVVMFALPEQEKVIVEGAGMVKRHQRQTRQTQQAGIIDKDMPIHVSNVMLICKACGPTRVGYAIDEGGKKFRVCRKCGEELESN